LEMFLQFNDKHFNYIKTLTFHLSNGCHNNISTCWLINCNNYIENLSSLIMTNHLIFFWNYCQDPLLQIMVFKRFKLLFLTNGHVHLMKGQKFE
jgi:hypothetical protein